MSNNTTPNPKKAEYRKQVDSWMTAYVKKTKGAEIKLWANFPDVVTLKVNGTVYFQLYLSKNGVRACAKTKLIPENVRPAGATIINDAFDLSIPTFSENIAGLLTKYADACAKSIADKAKAKADKQAEEDKAKAEKEEAKKGKKGEKDKAAA